VNESLFGEISDILFCGESGSFFLTINKFSKYEALYSKGTKVLHPEN
jgi:hypothetical protein